MDVHILTHAHAYTRTYIILHVYEREGEREREKCIHIYIYIYAHTYNMFYTCQYIHILYVCKNVDKRYFIALRSETKLRMQPKRRSSETAGYNAHDSKTCSSSPSSGVTCKPGVAYIRANL